jgi:anti-sigma regulatory factor (Ser/Thr protein kinase)
MVFTDGLSEAVDADMAEYGFDRLEGLMLSLAPNGGNAVVDGLRRAVAKWEGGRPAEDDKTVVVIERKAAVSAPDVGGPAAGGNRLHRLMARRDRGSHLSIPATLDALDNVLEWLRECDGISDLPSEEFTLVEHGIYEILANIAEHGCGFDPEMTIDVWWIVDECGAGGHFLVRDHGHAPHPEQWRWKEPETDAGLRRGRGYGLAIIRETMAEVEFHADTGDDGNVTLARYAVGKRSNLV